MPSCLSTAARRARKQSFTWRPSWPESWPCIRATKLSLWVVENHPYMFSLFSKNHSCTFNEVDKQNSWRQTLFIKYLWFHFSRPILQSDTLNVNRRLFWFHDFWVPQHEDCLIHSEWRNFGIHFRSIQFTEFWIDIAYFHYFIFDYLP